MLIINVVERPSVSSIEIEGNKAISTEDLMKGLKQSGTAEGEIFQRATLEGVRNELQRQYVARGRYSAEVDAEVVPQPRNRVALKIKINEGTVAAIQHINIVGNNVFDDETAQLFELKTTNWLSFFKNDDKYAREKLSGDWNVCVPTTGPWLHQHGHRFHPGVHHARQETRLHHRQHQRRREVHRSRCEAVR